MISDRRDLLLRECLQLLEAYARGEYTVQAFGVTPQNSTVTFVKTKFDEDVRAILESAKGEQ